MTELGLTWAAIRQGGDSRYSLISQIANSALRMGLGAVTSIEHMRTSYYAVFDVLTDHGRYVARVGQHEEDYAGDDLGPYGTSKRLPTGQFREFRLLRALADHGAAALPVLGIDSVGGTDIGWMRYQESLGGSDGVLTARQWGEAARSVWSFTPHTRAALPFMLNATKTFDRIESLPESPIKENLKHRYSSDLDNLLSAATAYGTIHGDLGPGNAMITASDDQPKLFDVETSCTGPLVWDYIYLVSAISAAPGPQPSVDELRQEFSEFSEQEIAAAWRVRVSSSEVRSVAKLWGKVSSN